MRGVIENMSWFVGDDAKRYRLFGSGGGEELARKLGVELIAQVPMTIPLREGSDHGRPIMAVDPDAEVSRVFAAMASWIDAHGPTKRSHPELRVG